MSLMNFGFTKSKLDRKNDEESQVSGLERQEAKMVSFVKKPVEKSQSKSPAKPTMNPDKEKMEKSSLPEPVVLLMPCDKDSPSKLNKKHSPQKLSPHDTLKTKTHKDTIKYSQDVHSPKVKCGDTPSSSKRPSSDSSGVSLPYQRIKMIMKSCPDVEIVPQESLHVITKATELFIHYLALKSLKDGDSYSLDYESLSKLVHSNSALEFLKETIPQKITWAECQKIILTNATKQDDYI